MYKILECNQNEGTFYELETKHSLEDCLNEVEQQKRLGKNVLFVYSPSKGEKNYTEKILEVIRLNDMKIISVMTGGEFIPHFPDPKDPPCCGYNNCFCVIANGKTQCQMPYYDGNLTYWVPCSMACNC